MPYGNTFSDEIGIVLKGIKESYENYHNLVISKKRLKKLMNIKTKAGSTAVKKMCEYLHNNDILKPYYDNEPIDQTKVWSINIGKVEEYLANI